MSNNPTYSAVSVLPATFGIAMAAPDKVKKSHSRTEEKEHKAKDDEEEEEPLIENEKEVTKGTTISVFYESVNMVMVSRQRL